ncbi:hypothetical protein EZJ43_13875 [Pedobacter changchengzhani]|uniref:Carboxypeptidase-like regulatory domain-containing protein n=1 Tax=Pedobacter changchengzhani TaxID=2529274 RepID=A0A4V2ZZX4_9SPHI|nr:carboxypeptidase-like regulatory domain-containing protein [Pedobacter changchengzhani]TDG35383.1 hypothetical protein EZJ43_13875 [Pedobacter changchengzhani]
MKKLIFLIVFSIVSLTCFAQTIKGKIIATKSKQPIPYATVKLKLANQTKLTTESGDFNIIVDKLNLKDTIFVSCIGYLSAKLPIDKLPKDGIIYLDEDEKTLKEVSVSVGKKRYEIINEFAYSNIKYTINKDIAQSYLSAKFPIAKKFTANVDSFKLEEIHLGRFVEASNEQTTILTEKYEIKYIRAPWLFYELKKHNERAIFNLYIIYPAENGEPQPLDQAVKIPISLTSAITDTEIDVRNYNIRPKQRNFYIAIEWLAILPNLTYSLGKRNQPKVFRQFTLPTQTKDDKGPAMALVYEIGYEPYVSTYRIDKKNSTKKYVWLKDNWVTVEPDSDGKIDTEFALSAKISYY